MIWVHFTKFKAIFKFDAIKIDNYVFRLHYKVTVLFLMTFLTVVSLNEYYGDPIDCFIDGWNNKKITESKMLDTYCWIHSTFTLPNPGNVRNDIKPLPGLGTPKQGDTIKYHNYYQFVGFFILFQVILFRIPRMLWKVWEGGKMEVLVTLMKSESLSEGNKPIDYLFAYWNHHILYCTSFFTCELLNFVNLIGQIFLVDVFFDGDFIKYGSSVVADSKIHPDDRMMDAMTRLFPKVTKCSFPLYGASGTIQNFDAICVLPVNMLNEKIFVFLWFWFFIVAFFTGIALLFRLISLLSSNFRLYLLKRQIAKCDMDCSKLLDIVFKRSQIGDWFVLMLLSQNIDSMTFKKVLAGLADRFEDKTCNLLQVKSFC